MIGMHVQHRVRAQERERPGARAAQLQGVWRDLIEQVERPAPHLQMPRFRRGDADRP